MKKILFVLLFVVSFLSAGFSQELIELAGSNQYQTTISFEMNPYDYLINPLHFHLLTDRWAFFGLDNDINQLAVNIVGNGINAGIALGGTMTPVFLMNYRTASNLECTEEAKNIEIDFTNYDQATGTYATVTEKVDQYIKNNEAIHNLVLHGGLSLSEIFALAFQFAMIVDQWNVHRTVYTNTYSNTASPSDATLTDKGNLTETTFTMRNDSENSYKIDLEAGFDLDTFSSRIVLGAGWFNPGSASNSYQEVVTVYNDPAGLDDTVQDQVTTTSYSGQYYYNGSLNASFDMGSISNYVEFFRFVLDTTNLIPLGEEFNLIIPFDFQQDIYRGNLNTVATTDILSYNDASATPVESSRDTTTETTSLLRKPDLRAATGATLAKTLHPTDNTRLHLGGGFDFEFIGDRDTRMRERVRHYLADNDGDGAYTTAGVDVNTLYREYGYEVDTQTHEYNFDFSGKVAVSYSPIRILTFHAGAFTNAAVDLESTSSQTVGDGGYQYETYTDILDATNNYTHRQKDGSNNRSTPSTLFSSDFDFTSSAYFGFTLEFSETFRIDARSTYTGNVGFVEFSVIGMAAF